MDGTTQAIDGAPGTITLGGKLYLVGQPAMEDTSAIAAFLKQTVRTHLQELQEDPAFTLLDEDEQRTKLKEAAKRQLGNGQKWSNQAALEALTSLSGVRFLAWLMIRKKQPEIGYEEICSLINDENRVPVSVQLDFATGMAHLGNSAGRPG